MGKGGEISQQVKKSVGVSQPSAIAKKITSKLQKLSTEELRKWAKQYGLNVKEDEERDVLIHELVSFSYTYV